MNKNPSERSEDIRIIIEERGKLTKACQQLSYAISEIKASELIKKMMDKEGYKDPKRDRVNKLIIEVSAILSNIAGSWDKDSKYRISFAKRLFSAAMAEPLLYGELSLILPLIAGFEVDFNKRPFKILKFSLGKISFQGEKQ